MRKKAGCDDGEWWEEGYKERGRMEEKVWIK